MSAPFPNHYIHRRVAESAAKACDVCYKFSSSVLITPDHKDFFYVCPVHLKDRYFCTPKIDEDAAKAAKENREKELAEEKEKLLKEYQERQEKKAKKEQEKKDQKDNKDKDEAKGKEDTDKDKKKEAASDEKPQEENKDDQEALREEEPRVFELKSSFYQQRLQRKRQAEAARRGRERVSQPDYFPSVPSEPPSK